MASVGAYQRKKRRIRFLDINHKVKVKMVIAIMKLAIAKKKKQIRERDVKRLGPFTPSSISNLFTNAEELGMMKPVHDDSPDLHREITRAWVEIIDEDLGINEELNKRDSIEATKESDYLLLERLRELLYDFDTIVFGNVRKKLNSNQSGI